MVTFKSTDIVWIRLTISKNCNFCVFNSVITTSSLNTTKKSDYRNAIDILNTDRSAAAQPFASYTMAYPEGGEGSRTPPEMNFFLRWHLFNSTNRNNIPWFQMRNSPGIIFLVTPMPCTVHDPQCVYSGGISGERANTGHPFLWALRTLTRAAELKSWALRHLRFRAWTTVAAMDFFFFFTTVVV